MIHQRIFTIRLEKLCQFEPFCITETRADSHMLQRARVHKQSKQQGTNQGASALLMPSKLRNHTGAIALMLDLEHHTFIRLVNSVRRFRDYPIEARTLKAPKPILCNAPVPCSRSEMNWCRSIL